MTHLTHVVTKSTIKFHQYFYPFVSLLPRPEYKFLKDITWVILKSKHIHQAKIARVLHKPIAPEKTEERLHYHLIIPDLFTRLLAAHLHRNHHHFNHLTYIICDGSDIIKPYATCMEGLCRVRDGLASTPLSSYLPGQSAT